MSLIKCKECEKEISHESNICPNCGAKNILINGEKWEELETKLKIMYIVLTIGTGLFTAWLLMAGLRWLASGNPIAAALVEDMYNWMFWCIAILIWIELVKDYSKGKFN